MFNMPFLSEFSSNGVGNETMVKNNLKVQVHLKKKVILVKYRDALLISF